MAHSTTMKTWSDQLVSSLVPVGKTSSTRLQRIQDSFARRLKHHNYARTNQFEVAERVQGLEEKLQVLNHDELSDALHIRLTELRSHSDQWLPDALDLLLRLSVDPANKSKVDHLLKIRPAAESPPPLKWSDVEGDDPIDRDDPIWSIQEYSDFSSDEDVYATTGTELSPRSPRKRDETSAPKLPVSRTDTEIIERRDLARELKTGQFWHVSDAPINITELQIIRESLFMLQGLPTTLFSRVDSTIVPNKDIGLQQLSPEVLRECLQSFAQIGSRIDLIRDWLRKPQRLCYMQAMLVEIQSLVSRFDSSLSQLQEALIDPAVTTVISLSQNLEIIKRNARGLELISSLLEQKSLTSTSGIEYLDLLFDWVCVFQSSCDDESFHLLLNVFLVTFKAYLKPVLSWVESGELNSSLDPFFVGPSGQKRSLSQLWHNWYQLDKKSTAKQPPKFLDGFSLCIFACGKTQLFLRHLDASQNSLIGAEKAAIPLFQLNIPVLNLLLPFSEVFRSSVAETLRSCLEESSKRLKIYLEERCGLWTSLDILDYIYFGKNGSVTAKLESKIFSRIDRCVDGWNDRFMIADLLEENFISMPEVDLERIIVHSNQTSARSMEHQRQSVRILGSLTIEYRLPWTLANIFPSSALTSYQRVSLILMQIRRARVSLLHRAHFYVLNSMLRFHEAERKFAQALQHSLLLFVDTLYDHLTSYVISSFSAEMRLKLKEAVDVDSMLEALHHYVTSLEEACLTSKKVKLIKDAILTVLDLCIRFSDVVSTSSAGRRTSDVEASSFISARSGARRKKDDDTSSSDDDDEEQHSAAGYGEGYSSFVVLDENSSPADEVRKIRTQFERHLAFIVAGLRGLGKSGGADEKACAAWHMLAERLDWKKSKARYTV